MSASPSGPTGNTPNGTAPAIRRRRAQANPLVANRRGPRKPQPAQRPRPPNTGPLVIGGGVGAGAGGPPRSTPTANPARLGRPNGSTSFAERPRSPEPVGQLTTYPVFAAGRDMLKDLRHHAARFTSKDSLDITNQEQFKRPIYLHRRDPRANMDTNGMEVDSKEDAEAEADRLKLEEQKAQRALQREENAKLIAPGQNTKKKPQAFKKKVEQVYRTDETPEDRKRNQLRYEEALPWFLEEMDNKNVWQGTYEAALSESHILLMPSEDGKSYRLLPLEKWYKFRERNKFKHLDIEEAEERMSSKMKEPRWFQQKKKEQAHQQAKEEAGNKAIGLFQRAGDREEKAQKEAAKVAKSEGEDYFGEGVEGTVDADDIDFDVNEEFADDEENALLEGDDDTQKLAEERIKRDQLNANIFGMTEEQEVDEEAQREKKLRELAKKMEKGTRKALLKREKNFDYESDSDGNPYSSESESEDSDTERAKEEERKKEEEAKAKLKGKEGDVPASGSSTKGTNTPSGRKEKHGDPLRKATNTIPSSSLKRPGSPNLSEASGNESSRKKLKHKHSAMSGTATPRPGGSPNPQLEPPGLKDRSRQPSFTAPLRGGAGSGSDTDGTNSGRTKLKLKMKGSPSGTPSGSRAQSPAPAGKSSRAASPQVVAATPSQNAGAANLPTKDEILAKIPPEGIPLKTLSNIFKQRVFHSPETQRAFIQLVKSITVYNSQTKMIVPRKS
ncbi:hypothetical protein EJ08DRAFT_192542 [Tothia fuscella]|uniref:Transcription initiation factor IIF subunit alpha n=1 Tax=Tothia fuscella TaxID=1048955 RepID=A0A9P4TZT2_9PEZI|nr:hypothetical protein EJ08DRAFT_192542 [Tothia fuscella]